jgi:hypothetical protein
MHVELSDTDLYLNGLATDHIWIMETGPESHPIGVRLDCGDSGVVYLSRPQAKDLAEQLTDFAATPASQTPNSCPSAETFVDNFLRGNLWLSAERESEKRDAIAVLLKNYAKHLCATPASTARTDGWVSVANGLPDDDSDVYAAIAWTHSPGVRKYVIHDCSYYEGGTGSGQKIFADCEGEEFEAKEVDFWIYKYRLAEQLPAPGSVPQAEPPK